MHLPGTYRSIEDASHSKLSRQHFYLMCGVTLAHDRDRYVPRRWPLVWCSHNLLARHDSLSKWYTIWIPYSGIWSIDQPIQGLRSLTQTVGCAVSLYLISPQMTGLMLVIVPVVRPFSIWAWFSFEVLKLFLLEKEVPYLYIKLYWQKWYIFNLTQVIVSGTFLGEVHYSHRSNSQLTDTVFSTSADLP